MKLILKNSDTGYFKKISLTELESFQEIVETFSSREGHIKAKIFAINETINSYQLAKFKNFIKDKNLNDFHIYSNDRETILTGKSLKIDSFFFNEKEIKRKLDFFSSKKQEDILQKGTIRSGERISSNGDLIIIGDVNPGAIVSAKENIFVWGKLLGIAYAGCCGNKNASITSLYLKPVQLRISEFVAIGPKEKPQNHYPEIAELHNQSIIIKPYIVNF